MARSGTGLLSDTGPSVYSVLAFLGAFGDDFQFRRRDPSRIELSHSPAPRSARACQPASG
jgi:hypothetical protein